MGNMAIFFGHRCHGPDSKKKEKREISMKYMRNTGINSLKAVTSLNNCSLKARAQFRSSCKMFLESEGDMSHRIFLCLYATSFPESFLFIPRGRKREAPGNEVGQKCNLKLRHTLFLARKSVSAQVKVWNARTNRVTEPVLPIANNWCMYAWSSTSLGNPTLLVGNKPLQ